jgi:hypothetical protein
MPGEASSTLALLAKTLRLPVVMISGSPDGMKFAADHGLQLLRKPFRALFSFASVGGFGLWFSFKEPLLPAKRRCGKMAA